MMIRVNGEYLDFDDDIEIESQIKLFEDIETSNGDYSYSFNISKTAKNLKALGFPFPDAVKSIYQDVPCEILDNSGFIINTGSLKIENVTDVISCSFFGGNKNWLSLLGSPMSDLPLQKYDCDLSTDTAPISTLNIPNSWFSTTGLVFPLIDAGALVTRSYFTFKVEDFVPMFYVKTLFAAIFGTQGIKLDGDLISDSVFDSLLVAANSRSLSDVQDRTSYVRKTNAQNITSLAQVTFQDDSTYPFYDGDKNNYSVSTNTYTADVKMVVDVELSANVVWALATGRLRIYKNGSSVKYKTFGSTIASDSGVIALSMSLPLNAGDTVQIFAELVSGAGVVGVGIGSTLKITPTYIYRVFGKSSVPNWTQGEFVSNILRIFNVLPSYNSNSKTLTLDLFNNIKSKEPIDVSDQIEINEVDFSEFVSNYAMSNIFSYQEGSDEDLREYNISNFISYGSGELAVNNDFIEESADIIESDFSSPITYLNAAFDMSMERINFVELEEIEDYTITGVTNSSSAARFNISNADDFFTIGDLIIIDTDVDSYNGQWVVSGVSTTYIVVYGVTYDSNATGTATILRHKFTTNDSVHLFINMPNISNLNYSANYGMSVVSPTLGNVNFLSASVAYFNLLANGRRVNDIYKQSLSFGSINNPLSYQKTLLDTYWPIFGSILNDPVMLRVSAYFKRKTYEELKTFLRPLRVKTNQTNNLYYLNRITGYKSGHEPCEVELIKL